MAKIDLSCHTPVLAPKEDALNIFFFFSRALSDIGAYRVIMDGSSEGLKCRGYVKSVTFNPALILLKSPSGGTSRGYNHRILPPPRTYIGTIVK